MSNEQQDKALFVSFCIEQYAKAKNISTNEAVDLLEENGILLHYNHHICRGTGNQTMTAITQNNLYLLLPAKIGWLAPWLSEDEGISLTDAIRRIYHSELYKKLAREDTKYWHLGPVDLYRELREEFVGRR